MQHKLIKQDQIPQFLLHLTDGSGESLFSCPDVRTVHYLSLLVFPAFAFIFAFGGEVLAAFGVRFCFGGKRLCRLSLRACSNGANKFCASVSEIKFALNVSKRSVARGTFGPNREMALRTDAALKFMSGGSG